MTRKPPIIVTELNFFPIKSCGGISLREAELVERGFRHDRRWMVTDSSGMFLTQRNHPKLALARPVIQGDEILLSAPGLPGIRIPLELHDGPTIPVQVWGSRVDAFHGIREADEWFGTLLGSECRLVFMPDTARRPITHSSAAQGEHVAFVDAFPILLISEASLADLNGRLASPVPMNRFRPNIVVRGATAFEEDTWRDIRIGNVPFLVAKPCDRCATTTVDQATGVKGTEPLKTLAAYRTRDGGVYFGQNVIHKARGTVRLGDTLTFL